MSKCIVITGPTNSGKTTLAKFFEFKGYRRIVTFTTRPPREGEVNGVDYHFVSDEVFDHLKAIGFFAETASYNADFGHCSYGSAVKDYQSTDDTVIVLNPVGIMQLTADPYIVWLDIPEEDIMRRAFARGDKPEEVARRVVADRIDFMNLLSSGKYNLRIREAEPLAALATRIFIEKAKYDDDFAKLTAMLFAH